MEFSNTKFDVRDWSEEQKVQFQEKCFELGYGWGEKGFNQRMIHIYYNTYYLNGDGSITFANLPDVRTFNNDHRVEKTWEDMFPTPKLDVSKEIATLVFEALGKMEEEVIQEEDEDGFENLTYVHPVTSKIVNWEVKNLSDLQIQFMLGTLRLFDGVSVKEVREAKYLFNTKEVGLCRSNLFLHGDDIIVSFNDTFKEV